ncbi:hypothetical protein M0R45_028662 [Rubus argutus]|uniref:Uncharacterized protein n=1 Tax=Rubus argutus TaxID=59490 RepID=A0AAW1WA06_RUBAR
MRSVKKESAFTEEKIPHTKQFSCLDKAAILGKDTKAEPWKVCTVTQVEEVKVLTRMLPILFSTIIMKHLLGTAPNFLSPTRKTDPWTAIWANLKSPPHQFRSSPSFSCPFSSHSTSISSSPLLGKSRNTPQASHSSKELFFVDIINSVTAKVTPSKLGWLHGLDINQNNVNLFYWFLAILSCINFVNYLYWASWYKYKTDEPDAKVELKDLNRAPLVENENGSKITTEEPDAKVELKDLNRAPLVENEMEVRLLQKKPPLFKTEQNK